MWMSLAPCLTHACSSLSIRIVAIASHLRKQCHPGIGRPGYGKRLRIRSVADGSQRPRTRQHAWQAGLERRSRLSDGSGSLPRRRLFAPLPVARKSASLIAAAPDPKNSVQDTATIAGSEIARHSPVPPRLRRPSRPVELAAANGLRPRRGFKH